jgi:hypothetical protein
VAPDLITSDYATTYLRLSTAELAMLPQAITDASALVRSYCQRIFSRRPSADSTLGPIDELITAPHNGQILLSEYPVNDVYRVSTSKTSLISIGNNDPITNQRAVAKMVATGDPIVGLTTTSLYLERWASGVKIPVTILFSSLATPTITDLASAVNETGGGWNALPGGLGGSDGTDYSLWPVSELVAGGAQGALQDDAEFAGWVDDAEFAIDKAAGILTLTNLDENPFTSIKWGPSSGLTYGDDEIKGEYQGVRVVYDAGYDPIGGTLPIPADLCGAVVDVIKTILAHKTASPTIVRERTVTWEIQYREIFHALPQQARETLSFYRSRTR